MTGPRFSFVQVMDHEVHVTEWGDPTRPPIVMWHGLARTGRDFDELALAMSETHFVICPDTIGRGLSSWSTNPEAEYCVEYLTGIAVDLLDHYGMDQVAWIGTSMGGLIGMRMAAGPLAERLNCLIVNDIGPEIPQEAIDRILHYAAKLPIFDHVSQADTWLRTVYQPFGPAAEGFWQRLTQSSLRRNDEGRITIHYDPNIVMQFSKSAHELESWDRYEKISLPMHVIWGKQSDILTANTVARMQATGPRSDVTIFEDCGHAPTLSRPKDIEIVQAVLAKLMGKIAL